MDKNIRPITYEKLKKARDEAVEASNAATTAQEWSYLAGTLTALLDLALEELSFAETE